MEVRSPTLICLSYTDTLPARLSIPGPPREDPVCLCFLALEKHHHLVPDSIKVTFILLAQLLSGKLTASFHKPRPRPGSF